MKKIISFALAVVMIAGLFSVIPMTVTAEESSTGVTAVGAVPTGYVPVGTAIEDEAGFANMTADGKYYLAKDIEITESYASKFTGTFDGNGYSIKLNGKPIFKSLGSCTIKNLTTWATGEHVTGKSTAVGAIVGTVSDSSNVVFENIANNVSVTATGTKTTAGAIVGTVSSGSTVVFENIVNNAPVTSAYRAGGLVGQILSKSKARFNRCKNTGIVKTTGSTSNMTGGILGYMQSYCLDMIDCLNTVSVSSEKNTTGGLLGRFGSDNAWSADKVANIIGCKNTGTISAGAQAGGLIGYARGATLNIISSSNKGTVTGKSDVGGMIGLAGHQSYLVTLNVQNCVNTGIISMTNKTVTETNSAGGILGRIAGDSSYGVCTIDKCVNLGTVKSTNLSSQFVGISENVVNHKIMNSIGLGKLEGAKNVVMGFTTKSDVAENISTKFTLSGNYYLEGEGTAFVSSLYNSTNAVYTEENFSDYLTANAGKITTISADVLASGNVTLMYNKLVGYTILYQNPDDAVPTLDSTHQVPSEAPKAVQYINSAEDFANMEADGNYILASDITVESTYANTFTGTFDGNGHRVKTSVALFKLLTNATVKNLVIDGDNAIIFTGSRAAVLALDASGITVENVTNNVDIKASYKNSCYVGGLVGQCVTGKGVIGIHEKSYFTNCVNNGNITYHCDSEKATEYPARVGGIVGNAAKYQYCIYTGCINNGNISVTGTALAKSPYIGGIAASSFGGEAENCINNGDIYCSAGAHMGGIIGRLSPSSQHTDQSTKAVGCVNTGDITLIDSNQSGSAAGMIGYAADMKTTARSVCTVERCINFGTVTSNGSYSGGMVGYIWGSNNIVAYSYGVVRNCVNLGKIEGQKNVETTSVTTIKATFVSHFICYVNGELTTIENSYGLGTLVNTNNDYNVIFGLSSYTALKYKVSNVYLAPNDGTKYFSYGHDAMVDDKDENGNTVQVLDDRSRNRVPITADTVAKKVTILTEDALSGNKVTELCNTLVGKELLYKNFSRDVNARTYSYGGKFFRLNEAGASVRAFADPEDATVGVRFRSLISKDAFDAIQKDVAEIGVLIAPKVLADAAGEMTFESLEAYKTSSGKTNVYVNVKRSGAYATSFSDEELTNGCYEIKGSLVNIKDASMEFAAVGYIKLKNGTVFYGSTDVNSAKAIATAAVADVKAAAETGYEYEVEAGVFSPYTKKAYESLKALAK